MDIKDNNSQAPATDDQELAKVLAGANKDLKSAGTSQNDSGLQFEEAPVPPPAAPSISDPAGPPPAGDDSKKSDDKKVDAVAAATAPASSAPAVPSDLAGIKKEALDELRPLVSKLNLPPDEKFDTLLLIIRSTDDQSLLGPAHDAAKEIPDETKRAEALLDVIKEIDYFSNPQK